MLKPYACDPDKTRGRRHAEPPPPHRTEYQRDRDRIVHSTAFRRLVYKTQVFLNHEGDLFRTRLTHSLEVAQLGRSIARTIGLNEDLVESLALAHDLGHAPFGHAGQDALNECLFEADPSSGGFEHNLQSLRIVDVLEERYPDFDGLNLTFETREGVLKHCSRRHAEELVAGEPHGIGERFLNKTQPSLEAQLCNLADEIAYNAHDVDDGVRSGLLSLEQLEDVPLFSRFQREARTRHPQLTGRRLLFEIMRRLLSAQVQDVLDASEAALHKAQPLDVADVRGSPPLIRFSDQMVSESVQLKRFLRTHLYRHPQVVATTDSAKEVVRDLFAAYLDQPSEWWAPRAGSPSLRQTADYIAGMTDRFAIREHTRLTGRRLFD